MFNYKKLKIAELEIAKLSNQSHRDSETIEKLIKDLNVISKNRNELVKKLDNVKLDLKTTNSHLDLWKPLAEKIASFEVPDEIALTVPEKGIKLLDKLGKK